MTSLRSGLITVVLTLGASAAFGSLFAQQLPSLAPAQRVRVTAPSAGLYQTVWTVEALSARDLTLLRERVRERGWMDTLHLTVPLDSISSVDVSVRQYSHEWAGAGVGALVGGVLGFFVGQQRKCSGSLVGCYNAEGGALLGGVIGAVAGGFIGDGFRSDEWLPVDLHRLRVGPVPQPGGRLGLAASLAL